MAKPIEVLLPDGGNSYHVGVEDAWELVHSGNAKWIDRKQIQRTPDRTMKVSWEPRQSGYAGPLVVQMIT